MHLCQWMEDRLTNNVGIMYEAVLVAVGVISNSY